MVTLNDLNLGVYRGKGFISYNTDYGFHGVFTCERKLSFKFVFALLMKAKPSIQRELDQLFKLASDPSVLLWFVSKSAFTQACTKVDPEVFVSLNKTGTHAFYQSADFYIERDASIGDRWKHACIT